MSVYMVLWSLVMLGLLGAGRLRSWQQWLGAIAGTALILFISQALFAQFSLTVGVSPEHGFINPAAYLDKGLIGWIALLVMPCGWVGSLLSLNIVRRWQPMPNMTMEF